MRGTKHLLLWSSLATLALLGWAARAENAQEWRVLQRSYRDLLPADRAETFQVQLRQIVVPELRLTDRCVTCHLGMSVGEQEVAGQRVFAAHPDVPHAASEFGCTSCHGGQGLATEKDAAHGDVRHWPEPMLPADRSFAGCGSCHTHLAVPNLATLRSGRRLFERYDCLSCHALDGRGGTLRPGRDGEAQGPELSRYGAGPGRPDWYAGHLGRYEAAQTGPWRESFGPLGADDLAALEVYLRSRVGAPGLVEAKALFHTLGCRGCHAVGGVGGDDGPELTHVGQRDPGQLDFSHVPGQRTLADWFDEHFRAPAVVVPGSQMPALGLGEEQIHLLTSYMLSLRRSPFPEAYWPTDRILATRFGEREFAGDGATLYGTFCAACHGPRGQGMRYPGMAAFPAIANEEFLSLADDEFLRETVRRGRPGRRMPAWSALEGGLQDGEIEAVVRYARRLGGGIAAETDRRPARWVRGDVETGAALFSANCAACHGAQGEGKEGVALNNRVLLESASDTYLTETIRRGRSGTSMPAYGEASPVRRVLSSGEIESIVAFMRGWEERR